MAGVSVRPRRQSRRFDRLPNKIKQEPRRKPLKPPLRYEQGPLDYRERAAGAEVEERLEVLAPGWRDLKFEGES